MTTLEPFLAANAHFAEGGGHLDLQPIPRHQLMVVTCMDGRVDPAHILGVELGDALVVRNAGGRVTNDVIDEIAFLAELTEFMFGDEAPPFEVAVIHHTGCGSGMLADPGFRAGYAVRIDADEGSLAELAVVDPTATVATDVTRLRHAASIPDRIRVSGHVYDVETGTVTTIVPPDGA